jgi:hypothetical protein
MSRPSWAVQVIRILIINYGLRIGFRFGFRFNIVQATDTFRAYEFSTQATGSRDVSRSKSPIQDTLQEDPPQSQHSEVTPKDHQPQLQASVSPAREMSQPPQLQPPLGGDSEKTSLSRKGDAEPTKRATCTDNNGRPQSEPRNFAPPPKTKPPTRKTTDATRPSPERVRPLGAGLEVIYDPSDHTSDEDKDPTHPSKNLMVLVSNTTTSKSCRCCRLVVDMGDTRITSSAYSILPTGMAHTKLCPTAVVGIQRGRGRDGHIWGVLTTSAEWSKDAQAAFDYASPCRAGEFRD